MSEEASPARSSRWGRDAILTVVQAIGSIATSAVATIILARWLGRDGLGVYQVSLLVPVVAVNLLSMGIPVANTYFLARNEVTIAEARRFTWKYSVTATAVAAPILYALLVTSGDEWVPGVPTSNYVTGLVLIPVMLVETCLRNILRGKNRFAEFNVCSVFGPLSQVCLLLVMMFYRLDPVTGLLCFLGAEGIRLGLTGFLVNSEDEGVTSGASPSGESYGRRAMVYGSKLQVWTFSAFLSYRVDVFLLNVFAGAAAAGLYVVAVLIAERVGTISQYVQLVVLPRVAAMDDEERRRFTPVVHRWVLGTSTTASLVVAIGGWYAIRIVFGAEYTEAYNSLLALLPGIVALGATRVLGNDLAGRNRLKIPAAANLAGLLLNIGLNLWLIPRFGPTGAAIASSISYSFVGVIVATAYVRISRVEWWRPFFVLR